MSILIAYLIIGLVWAVGSALDEYVRLHWMTWTVWVPVCALLWPCLLLIGQGATGLRYHHYDERYYLRQQSDHELYGC